jgi:hypothetical protein
VRKQYWGYPACALFSDDETAHRWWWRFAPWIGHVHLHAVVMFIRAGIVTLIKPMTCRVVTSRAVPLRSG